MDKDKILKEAKEAGIVDIDSHNTNGDDSISLETIKLATELTKKHAPRVYRELEERRKSQQ